MDRIINPYNVLAFYTEILEEQEDAPINSPHRMIIPWQVEFASSEVSGGVTATIVDENLTLVKTIPGASVDSDSTSDGKTYITYKAASDFSTVLPEGMYRVKLVTGDDTYYSHPICVSNAFQEMEFQPFPSCTSASGGAFTYAMNIVSKPTAMEANFEVDYGNGYEWIGSTSGAVESVNIIGSGDVTLPIRRNVFYPDGSLYYKEYSLAINTVSGCNGSPVLTVADVGGRHYDNYMYLEFYNSKDLSGLGLLYQDNYKQRAYFHAAYAYSVPVVEETFLQDGQNNQFLETASLAEQLNIDVYPVADYLVTVLQSVRHHDTVILVTCADEKRTTLENFQFTTRETDNDNKLIGRITGEINKVFVKGCQANKTII